MDAIECMRGRRSVRKYLDVPVEWDKVATILDCGRLAPSAGNVQNWKFIVVGEKGTKEALAQACVQQLWIGNAPVVIVIVSEPEKCKRYYGVRGERLYSVQNCAAAAQNMLNAAHALGLGGCWVGAFDPEEARKVLKIPDELEPIAFTPLGYPDDQPRDKIRKPIEEIIRYDIL